MTRLLRVQFPGAFLVSESIGELWIQMALNSSPLKRAQKTLSDFQVGMN